MKTKMPIHIKDVVNQVVNMLYNNVVGDNGLEPFEGWCQNGEVFEDCKTKEKDIAIMKRLAPLVDNLSHEIWKIQEEEKS